MRLPPLPTISDIIRLYKLSAAKKLSQNFILNMPLNRKIVGFAGDLHSCHVCEVGPGPGGITRAILEQDISNLYVIEKDRRFFPGLQMLSDVSGRLTAFHGDALTFDMNHLFPDECIKAWTEQTPDIRIIGNLPFSISTPLIFRYMEAISNRTGAWRYGRTPMTLTFQKEVAQRIVAEPNSDYRSRVSIDVQNWCHVKLRHVIPGRAFVPPPDVDVGVVHLVPRKQSLIDLPYRLITKVNRHLFHYRQKHCKNSLQTLFPRDQPDLLMELLHESDIDECKASYQMSFTEISRICHAYEKMCKRLPYIFDYDYRNPKSKKGYESLRTVELEHNFKDTDYRFKIDKRDNQNNIVKERRQIVS